MSDWIGLGIIVAIALCALFGLMRLSKPYEVSIEEFEKRAHEAPSLISAGMTGIQRLLDPAVAKSMETRDELKQGRYDKKKEAGDKPEAGETERKEGL